MTRLTQQLRDEILAIDDPVLRGRWQKFFAIPTDLQNILFDQIFADKIGEIIKEKYQLGYENMTKVAKIIGLIFLRFSSDNISPNKESNRSTVDMA